MKKLCGVLTLFLCATVAAWAAGKYPGISQEALKQAIADKSVVLLDVNGSDSFKAGHIPGAIDYAVCKDQLADLLPADKHALIVAYCGGEMCTAYQAAAEAAEKLGYTNVKHFSPGISGWRSSGEKVEPGS
ncbi:MAG: rhodanese-like domain-containing protein [Opitutaceae bacterium]|nr:rhodanese-like domain-containing protein [Opitutaceae bacterium]